MPEMIAVTKMVPKCLVVDCQRAAKFRGWCKAHYMRWQRYGDPGNQPIRANYHARTEEERFLEFVNKTETCWLWTGGTTGGSENHRYGSFRRSNGKQVYAHRVAWELWRGPIPPTLTIDHMPDVGCTSTLCVWPEHMQLLTRAENARQAALRRRASAS